MFDILCHKENWNTEKKNRKLAKQLMISPFLYHLFIKVSIKIIKNMEKNIYKLQYKNNKKKKIEVWRTKNLRDIYQLRKGKKANNERLKRERERVRAEGGMEGHMVND